MQEIQERVKKYLLTSYPSFPHHHQRHHHTERTLICYLLSEIYSGFELQEEYLTVIATKLIQRGTALTTLLPSNSNYSVSVSEMQNVKTRENVGNKENTCFNTGVFVAFGRWILVPIGPEYCHFPLLGVKFQMFLFTFFYAAFSYSCFCTEFFSRFTLSSQVKLW